MNNRQFSELLKRYLNGDCNEDEAVIVEQWYTIHETDADYLDTLSGDERNLLQHRMLDKVMDNVTPLKVIPLYKKWWVGTAAALIMITLAAILFSPKSGKKVFNSDDVVYSNISGSILKKTLPDGSTVWLQPNASLRVPRVFTAHARRVTMNGECFFEITKNPKRPFIITSAHIITKVWGTSFKVVDYDKSTGAMVKVLSGKVSVSKKDPSKPLADAGITGEDIMLAPQQKVTYTEATKVLLTDRTADMTDMSLWNRVDFTFDAVKLSSIAAALSERFNVEIIFADAHLKDKVMTADLSGLNLPEVLDVLKASMKINYDIKGNQVTLKKN